MFRLVSFATVATCVVLVMRGGEYCHQVGQATDKALAEQATRIALWVTAAAVAWQWLKLLKRRYPWIANASDKLSGACFLRRQVELALLGRYPWICKIPLALALINLLNKWLEVDLKKQDKPDKAVSVKNFLYGFMGAYSYVIYAGFLEPPIGCIAWPRFASCAIIVLILFELMQARGDKCSTYSFVVCMGLTVVTCILLIAKRYFPVLEIHIERETHITQWLILGVAALLVYGNILQVMKLRSEEEVGGVSKGMNLTILVKDITVMIFGIVIGNTLGWPFYLSSAASAISKGVILYHCFFWVKHRELAKQEK